MSSENVVRTTVNRLEMRKFQRRRRLVVGILMILFLVPLALVGPYFPRRSFAGVLIHAAALGCLSAAVLIRVWSAVHVGGRKQLELVESGPYALARNPLYVGTLFGALGAGLAFGSILLGALLCGFTFLVFDRVVKLEEMRLRDEFGAAFDAYAARVPRWAPRTLTPPPATLQTVDVAVVMRTCMQALVFFSAVVAAMGLDALRVAGWLAPLIRLP